MAGCCENGAEPSGVICWEILEELSVSAALSSLVMQDFRRKTVIGE
jgi:hypothetical protein